MYHRGPSKGGREELISSVPLKPVLISRHCEGPRPLSRKLASLEWPPANHDKKERERWNGKEEADKSVNSARPRRPGEKV